jgi:transposase
MGLAGCHDPGMEKRDFRSIGRQAQEELRRRALVLIVQEGMSQARAALVVGVHRQTVNVWLKRYRERGADGVLDGRRVSPRRGKGLLTEAEARQVRGWVTDRTPGQLDLPWALWTAHARCATWSSCASASGSGRRPCGAPPAALGNDAAGAADAGQGALAGRDPRLDRAGLSGERQARQGCGGGDLLGRRGGHLDPGPERALLCPRGPDPGRSPETAERITRSMIAAVSNRGLMRFMLYDGALDADRFITFLRRLIKDARQRVFLIVDNLKVHHARKVKAWVASHAHEIELFHLPAYAPDHNPDECLNNDLKQRLRQKLQPGSKDELVASTRSVMRAIQRSPQRVRAYFRPEPVRYAA